MEALRELEQRLSIKPLDFNKYAAESSFSPSASQLIIEDIAQPIENPCDLGDHKQAWSKDYKVNFKVLSQKWKVLEPNLRQLYNHVLSIYNSDKASDKTVQEICAKLLSGMYFNNIEKADANTLINQLNRCVYGG